MPPLEGRLVGDAARLGRALDGDVVVNELMKETQVESSLRQCSRTATASRGEPPAAAAAPPRDAGSDGAAPPDRSSDCSFEVVTRAIEMSNGSSPQGCG